MLLHISTRNGALTPTEQPHTVLHIYGEAAHRGEANLKLVNQQRSTTTLMFNSRCMGAATFVGVGAATPHDASLRRAETSCGAATFAEDSLC